MFKERKHEPEETKQTETQNKTSGEHLIPKGKKEEREYSVADGKVRKVKLCKKIWK